MRRLVPPLLVLIALVAAAMASGSPTHRASFSTALFSLRVDYITDSNTDTTIGTGKIDNTRRISSFDYTQDGWPLHAIVSSVPILTVYLSHSGTGAWSEMGLDEIGQVIDPAVALRIDARSGRRLGTEKMDGVTTTKYALTLKYPESALIEPLSDAAILGPGIPVTAWIDSSGAVHRMHAVITVRSGTYLISTTVIDERLSGFGSAVQVNRPVDPSSRPMRANLAESVLDAAIPDIESYFGDHHRYTGMTPRAVRVTTNLVFPDVKIVRATATSYCVQATVNGVTAHQNGPKAPYAAGPC